MRLSESLGFCLFLLACSSVEPQPGDAAQDAEDRDAAGDGDQTSDAASSQDAGSDAQLPELSNSMPLSTPLDSWTFLPIEGARCANGTATGVGINRSAQSDDLVIIMEGGGACWDANTCFVLKTAVHVEDTYDAAFFQTNYAAAQPPAVRDPQNPLALATQVFVPYCTGDLHGGTTVREYSSNGQTRSVHHVGALNMEATLARLYAGLPAPRTIWLLGSSAGGYGSTLNLQAVERTFPQATVHMLADSAPALTPAGGLWSTWQTAWELRLPASCPQCKTRFGAVVDAIAEDDRHGRIGLLAYEQDATIGAFFGFDGAAEKQALGDLFTESYQHADTRYFVASGTNHVMITSLATQSAQNKVVLQNWLVTWILGIPFWENAL